MFLAAASSNRGGPGLLIGVGIALLMFGALVGIAPAQLNKTNGWLRQHRSLVGERAATGSSDPRLIHRTRLVGAAAAVGGLAAVIGGLVQL